MTTEQIKNVCIESAKKYYWYLKDAGKGLEKIEIKSIKNQSEGKYILTLSKKIYDIDYVFLELYGQSCKPSSYSIIEYDYDSNKLLVFMTEPLGNEVMNTDLKNVFIVSDLTYLVRRVRDWYMKYGHRVIIDRPTPTLAPVTETGCSKEQANAIKNIFSSGLSYIWGAPGTGKTKYVLSNAILNYVKNNNRVMIIAPTNNALEQTLYGVLSIFEQNGIPTKKVLRIGTPSAKFAKEYAECCESVGIQKKLYELEKRIELCKKKLQIKKREHNYKMLKIAMHHLMDMHKQRNDIEKDLEKTTREIQKLKSMSINIDSEINELNQSLEEATEHGKYLSNSLFRAFSHKKIEKTKTDIELVHQKISLAKEKKHQNNNKIIELNATFITQFKEKEKISDQINNSITELHQKAISEQIKYVNLNSIYSVYSKLMEMETTLTVLESEPNDGEPNMEELTKHLQQLVEEREKIREQTIENRIKTVNVIAITIDGFIHKIDFDESGMNKYYEVPFNISHVFLDEAGYCSLIKAASLLAYKCPVTLLGDHMQLPPVCEMNEPDIEKPENNNIFLWTQSAIAIDSIFEFDFNEAYDIYKNEKDVPFINIRKSDLTKTFRFGNRISAVLNEMVYKNGFHSDNALDDSMIHVISVAKSVGKKKRENPAEAQAIKQLIQTLKPNDVAILSPYSNQVKLIGNCLPSLRNEQLIMTVHASQGKEWDVVILSVVDTTDKWFTNSKNKVSKGLRLLNTAVSRAREHLIIVCDADYWINEQEQLITELIKVSKR